MDADVMPHTRMGPVRGSVIVAAVVMASIAGVSDSDAGKPRAIVNARSAFPRTRELVPPVRGSYGWPLRPFNRQHAIRGTFGDPRFGVRQRNFHSGIDIAAPGGTPVFAVEAGTVFLAPDRVIVLRDSRAGRATGFSYWHVVPDVREYGYVARHALIGWVSSAWRHVHFAELQQGAWVNPLRPVALAPFRDPKRPRVAAIKIVRSGVGANGRPRVDVLVDVFVDPPLAPPVPWQNARLVPDLLRWRFFRVSRRAGRWRTVLDFRRRVPSNHRFSDVYAPGTVPNRPGRPGRYVFYLARGWDVSRLPVGSYRLEVEASSTRGPTVRRSTDVEVERTARGRTLLERKSL